MNTYSFNLLFLHTMLSNTLNFRIEGIEGDLKLVYSAFSQKLYQDEREVKRKGNKFQVKNDNGEQEELKLIKGIDFAYKAEFRGQKTQIEEKLTVLQYILGLIPLCLIVTGGVIGAFIGILGTTIIYTYIRKGNDIFKQVIIALVVSAVCAVIYFAIALILSSLLYGSVNL